MEERVVSIILTVFNKESLVNGFFLQKAPQVRPHEFIIVDNGSRKATTGVLKYLSQQFDNVRVIYNEDNLGFGVANNIGARNAHGDVLVFTQPDVQLKGDVTTLIDEHVVDGKLYGHVLYDHDTGWNVFRKEGQKVTIPYLPGYFLACTPTTWEKLGGFDSIYWPADFEDVDLSYTAVQNGIELTTLQLPISHPNFGSTWAQFDNRVEYTMKNRSKFMRKWEFDNE
jgi:GT2 family glycosyltransferase